MAHSPVWTFLRSSKIKHKQEKKTNFLPYPPNLLHLKADISIKCFRRQRNHQISHTFSCFTKEDEQESKQAEQNQTDTMDQTVQLREKETKSPKALLVAQNGASRTSG